jgi:hypothetical protein
MRPFLKLIHTLGAIGMMGALICLLVLLAHLPDPGELAEYASLRMVMGDIARWILLPSITLVLCGGLLALGLNRTYQNAGWAWIKMATGILVFEGTLVSIQGPLERQAETAARALAGEIDPSRIEVTVGAEFLSIWVMLGVAVVNVILGIWRPRLSRRKSTPAEEPADSR